MAFQITQMINFLARSKVSGLFSFKPWVLIKVLVKGHLDIATRVRAQSLCTFLLHAAWAAMHKLFADWRNRRKCLQNSEMLEPI